MSEVKKVKVKVKKRKINVKKIIILVLFICLFYLLFCLAKKIPLKNIYIIDNSILSDKEIIELANISDYPPYIEISKREITSKLKKNAYIKEVKIEKKFFNKIYIYITENKVLCMHDDKIILESGDEVYNNYNITQVPILLSDISSVYENFVNKMSLVDNSILTKISEITYVPNEVDQERFTFKMNDGNLVYITLSKITKINRYNSIYSEMEGQNGIIYLDSGDYIELK